MGERGRKRRGRGGVGSGASCWIEGRMEGGLEDVGTECRRRDRPGEIPRCDAGGDDLLTSDLAAFT